MKIKMKRRRFVMGCHDAVLLGISYFRPDFNKFGRAGVWGRYV